MRVPSGRHSSASANASSPWVEGGATTTMRPTDDAARSAASARCASGTPAMRTNALFAAPGSSAATSSGGPPASKTVV